MSSTKTFRIQNSGSIQARITSVSINPDDVGFSIGTSISLPYVIDPGLSLEFPIVATSTAMGTASAQLVVQNDTPVSEFNALLTAYFPPPPPDVPDPVGWWDASAITGLSNNDDIPNWFDISGNNYTMVKQSGVGPKYLTNIQNGLPAVYINEFPAYWMRTAVITMVVRTVVIACRINKPTFSNDYGIGGGPCFVSGEGGQRGDLGQTVWNLAAMNPTTGPVIYYRDNTEYPSGEAALLTPHIYVFSNVEPETTPGQYLIGTASTVSTQFGIDCHIFEIRCYDQILTAGQVAIVNTELSTKWGI